MQRSRLRPTLSTRRKTPAGAGGAALARAWALAVAALAAIATATPSPAAASGPAERDEARSGREIYDRTCSACHATGVAGAPRHGDATAWKPLIEEGQDVLTAHAWVGVRAMPPRGGDPDLSLAGFARAVAYMARAAGGDWADPDEAMLERIRAEEAKRRASSDDDEDDDEGESDDD